jgi:hypothetical protein
MTKSRVFMSTSGRLNRAAVPLGESTFERFAIGHFYLMCTPPSHARLHLPPPHQMLTLKIIEKSIVNSQYHSDPLLSLLYWTFVGWYIVLTMPACVNPSSS